MAQRKSKQESTRERMIRVATELFHRKGIRGTSIDDVLSSSGTGKSQFTYYFGNKEGLLRSIIENLHEVIRSGKAPTGYDLTTWEDLEGWFQRYIDFQNGVACELSCPLGTIGGELGDEQELLRQDVKLFFEWCTAKLTRFFAERRAAGELDQSVNVEALADLCLVVMEGGMLMSKIKRETGIFENAATQTLAYIKSLKV